MIFIDSNIIIRFVLNDNPQLSPKAFQIIKQIEEGQIQVYLAPVILAEIVYVLLKVYKLDKAEIRDKILPIISLKNIKMDSKDVIPKTFELFVIKNVDFEDAYLVTLMRKKQINQIYSFDEDFDKFPNITRLNN